MGSSINYRKATMKAQQTLAHRIRARRKALELTQEELAKRSSVKQSTISLIESGQTLWLKGTTLLRLASALGVTPEWINTGNDTGAHVRTPDDSNERELVEVFRTLSPEAQRAVLATARAVASARGREPHRIEPHREKSAASTRVRRGPITRVAAR